MDRSRSNVSEEYITLTQMHTSPSVTVLAHLHRKNITSVKLIWFYRGQIRSRRSSA